MTTNVVTTRRSFLNSQFNLTVLTVDAKGAISVDGKQVGTVPNSYSVYTDPAEAEKWLLSLSPDQYVSVANAASAELKRQEVSKELEQFMVGGIPEAAYDLFAASWIDHFRQGGMELAAARKKVREMIAENPAFQAIIKQLAENLPE